MQTFQNVNNIYNDNTMVNNILMMVIYYNDGKR
jgi:hypothetical protein